MSGPAVVSVPILVVIDAMALSMMPSPRFEPADRDRHAEPIDRTALRGFADLSSCDPEDAPLHVEDGTAAVAWVDRSVQLNQSVRIDLAHDAGRDRALQFVRRANDDHTLADLRRAGALKRHNRDERAHTLELQYRKITVDVLDHHL